MTINATDIIKKIMSAHHLGEILDVKTLHTEYKTIVKLIHPDICKHPDATTAISRLNELKAQYEDGKTFKDHVCKIVSNGYWVRYEGDKDAKVHMFRSLGNWAILDKMKHAHFSKYIPQALVASSEPDQYNLVFNTTQRIVPLTGLKLPQEHVNWILSRLLEFCAWLAQNGYAHLGITPETVFICPETHGIIIGSFYHMTPIGQKVTTIAGPYRNWYPTKLLKDKIALNGYDAEMCKRLAVYLLGEKSGIGVKLMKTHSKEFINFITTSHENCYLAFSEYRKLLSTHFPSKFHILNI
jgi:hypothetical protein